MNRDKWIFKYTVGELLVATTTKVTWHEGRWDFWKKKRDEKIAEVKASGIEIDESVLFENPKMSASNSSNYRQPSVQIRTDLVNDINECNNKVTEHNGKLKGYQAWQALLDASKRTDVYELNQDDWLYFYGK